MSFFCVGIAGFFGAISRFLIYKAEAKLIPHNFPYGTLIINLLGCFLLGLTLSLGEKHFHSHKLELQLFAIGFIGSFTTFSTFSADTLYLLEQSLYGGALFNILLNVILGILLVFAGKSILHIF